MSKRVFLHGKSVKLSELSDRQLEIECLLKQEKQLTQEWYRRMSGETPWGLTIREEYQGRFDALSDAIKDLHDKDAAEWFSTLPQ